jgi:hypothetical protein
MKSIVFCNGFGAAAFKTLKMETGGSSGTLVKRHCEGTLHLTETVECLAECDLMIMQAFASSYIASSIYFHYTVLWIIPALTVSCTAVV